MTVLGAVFVPQLPPERLRAVAIAADDAGVEELWLWEDCFLESGIANAAVALAATTRIRVGLGLLPAPLRNVALTAMEAATLERMFPGRLHLGVGHGVQEWMQQAGGRVESPVTLLREYVVALRGLLSGERVSVDGRYVKLDDVALGWPPASAPDIFTGAAGPRSLRLSGEISDGTVITAGTSPAQLAQLRRVIDKGRNLYDFSRPHRLVVYVHAATGSRAAERLEAERVRWKYESMTDVGVAGDAAAVAAAVQRWAEAGADTVVLQPTPDDPDIAGFMRFVGTQVRPLVS